MRRLAYPIVVAALTACASTSEWRAVRIDGTSETTFRESVTRLNEQLPSSYYRRMFAIALADVARDGAQVAGEMDEASQKRAYTEKVYRARLDGLTYKGVITLADQKGTPVAVQYYAGRPRSSGMGAPSQFPNPTAQGFSDSGRGNCSGCTAW